MSLPFKLALVPLTSVLKKVHVVFRARRGGTVGEKARSAFLQDGNREGTRPRVAARPGSGGQKGFGRGRETGGIRLAGRHAGMRGHGGRAFSDSDEPFERADRADFLLCRRGWHVSATWLHQENTKNTVRRP